MRIGKPFEFGSIIGMVLDDIGNYFAIYRYRIGNKRNFCDVVVLVAMGVFYWHKFTFFVFLEVVFLLEGECWFNLLSIDT